MLLKVMVFVLCLVSLYFIMVSAAKMGVYPEEFTKEEKGLTKFMICLNLISLVGFVYAFGVITGIILFAVCFIVMAIFGSWLLNGLKKEKELFE